MCLNTPMQGLHVSRQGHAPLAVRYIRSTCALIQRGDSSKMYSKIGSNNDWSLFWRQEHNEKYPLFKKMLPHRQVLLLNKICQRMLFLMRGKVGLTSPFI